MEIYFVLKVVLANLSETRTIFGNVQEDMSHDKIAEVDSQSKVRFPYILIGLT